jgi:(p)ppGpp synthase/HD superfamily hydrolase
MSIVLDACYLATKSHFGQMRKYTGRPYIEHPMRVAGRVTLIGGSEEMIAAAWLHDVLEDTTCSMDTIDRICGSNVLGLVQELTNPSKGSTMSRANRKLMDRNHLAKSSVEARTIKCMDRLDNLSEMQGAPWDFVRLYLNESRLLAEAIGDVPGVHELNMEILRLEAELPESGAGVLRVG